jgi:hypothetical protein
VSRKILNFVEKCAVMENVDDYKPNLKIVVVVVNTNPLPQLSLLGNSM